MALSKREVIFFAIIALVFFATRFWGILDFPIFNDESLYLQYSELIHDDFSGYKYISVGNVYNDWKPPLQYWLGALAIDISENPLFSGRIVSVLFSFVGLLGVYLLARNLYGKKEAVIAAGLFTVSSLTLFYNTQFVAETFVFSSGALFFALTLAAIKQEDARGKTCFAAGAIITGAALLLLKQSGALYLFLSAALPLIALQKNSEGDEVGGISRKNKKPFLKNIAAVAIIIIFSFVIYKLAIPGEFWASKQEFTSRWAMTATEIFSFPLETWRQNAVQVSDIFSHYYSWAALVIVLIFTIRGVAKRDMRDTIVSLLWLGGTVAVLFLLKGFNEYVYHTATIPFLIIIMARVAAHVLEYVKKRTGIIWKTATIVLGILCLYTTAFWIYQTALIKISPIKYLEQSTDWAKSAYLTGWSSGFGVPEVVDFLKKTEGDGIIITDSQWGNPGTAIQVFHRYWYQNIAVFPLLVDFFDERFRARLKTLDVKSRFFIFSDWVSEDSERSEWYHIVKNEFCLEEKEFAPYDGQIPIAVCSF